MAIKKKAKFVCLVTQKKKLSRISCSVGFVNMFGMCLLAVMLIDITQCNLHTISLAAEVMAVLLRIISLSNFIIEKSYLA